MHTYRVTWHVKGTKTSHTSQVLIVDGESTVKDIPVILAIRYLDGRQDAKRIVVDNKIKVGGIK